MPQTLSHPPCALVILDGFGFSSNQEGNAIAHASMPTWNNLWNNYPHTQLNASGIAVGLPSGFMGNSEVGHLTLGSGRIISSILKQFNDAINDDSLAFHPLLNKRFSELATGTGRLHLMGLLSDGGVHSHESHLHALLERAVELGLSEIFVHAFLDGRDVLPQSAASYLEKLDAIFARLGKGKLASIQGRFYAMDRDHNWDRTEQSYNMLMGNTPSTDKSWKQILEKNYNQQITDEFIPPTRLHEHGFIQSHDGVLFFNFRPDRARQLSQCFLDQNFTQFQCKINRKNLTFFMTTIRYQEQFKFWDNDILFQDQHIQSTLLDEFNAQTHGQFKSFIIAETEKYAHVTYFFRGMREMKKPQEIYILVPSIKSKNYVQHPEMSASLITAHVIKSLKKDPSDFYLINYANADMVGHSGNFDATIKACEVIDQQLATLYEEFVVKRNGTLFITADHGNAEQKIDTLTQEPLTAHTTNQVPFVMANKSFLHHKCMQDKKYGLCNVAPTILHHFNFSIPKEMSIPIAIQE